MPTYVYETIPQSESEEPTQFEVLQKISDKPLTEHPDTGQPVQRIISAGLAILSKKSDCCSSKCNCG